MTVYHANAPAKYRVRQASSWIDLWEWEVEWCQDGHRHLAHGYRFTQDKAEAAGQRYSDKINDPKRWWNGQVPSDGPLHPPPAPGNRTLHP